MKQYSMREVEKAVNGVLVTGDGKSVVSSVSKDSREAVQGDLFFPIVGETHDGHVFLPQALERGCRDFIVSSPRWADELGKSDGIQVILVEDTAVALGLLAGDYLKKLDIRIIGITGSTGKTSTKDLTRHVCSAAFKTGYTKGNLNNHIGLPLSILDFHQDTEVGILEMGMDKPGEIDYLAKIARPHIGLITNIGISHIENVGSRQGIFRCKMEITNYFKEDDVLIVSRGDDFLQKSALKAEAEGRYRLQVCGPDEDCDFVLSHVMSRGEEGVDFVLEHRGSREEFSIPVPGAHNAKNAALAIAAGFALGIPMATAAKALSGASLTEGRLAVKKAGGITIIDDTYNASPDSVRAAIDLLVSMEGRRKVAVLGDMYELGKEKDALHREVGRYAKAKGVDCLHGVGKTAVNIARGFGSSGKAYIDKNDFIKVAEDEIRRGDVVLVKGSRGMAMEEIARHIIEKRSK